jgi:epoxide hydrolase-like predicted phosphatase
MNSPIKAVVFDVGGVLVRTFDHSGRRAWERRLGLASGELEAIVLNSEMGRRAQRGEISDAELWQWVDNRFNLGDELGAFRRDFWKGDAVDRHLMRLIRGLRKQYQTAIISNATNALQETLAGYGLLDEFDLVIGSAYEGVMKPDPAIYRRALEKLGRTPEETVFIDDAPRNIDAARALGMAVVLFTPQTELEKELAALGVAFAADEPAKA